MTDSPPETAPEEAAPEAEAAAEPALAAEIAAAVGASNWSHEHDTLIVDVPREQWAAAVTTTAERLPFFSWLSAVDWSREVAVGEPVEDVDGLEERFDVLCRLSSVTNADAAILRTRLPKDAPVIDSIVERFPGAGWHEREAAEMFGIDFTGNPNLAKLYLPDSFEGNPLLKSFPLLSREVKPWPGTVDVEDMPSTENVEAEAQEGDGEE